MPSVLPALSSEDDLAQADALLGRREREHLIRLRDELIVEDVDASSDVRRACAHRDRRTAVLTVYRTVCVVVRADSPDSTIAVSELAEPLRYRGKAYRRALCVTWGARERDPRALFKVVSQLLLEELKDMR